LKERFFQSLATNFFLERKKVRSRSSPQLPGQVARAFVRLEAILKQAKERDEPDPAMLALIKSIEKDLAIIRDAKFDDDQAPLKWETILEYAKILVEIVVMIYDK
jgi:hypothetical protein